MKTGAISVRYVRIVVVYRTCDPVGEGGRNELEWRVEFNLTFLLGPMPPL